MNRRVSAVIRKEFQELRRDPITLWIALAFPLILLLLFGYAINLDVNDVRIAVVDFDRTSASATLVAAFENTGDFVVHRRPEDTREAGGLLDRGAVRMVLVIPHGFAREIRFAGSPQVQTLVDGTYPSLARTIAAEADAVVADFRLRRLDLPQRSGTGLPVIIPEPRVWFNPALRSRPFVVSGLFAVILMAFPPLLTVLAVVREKESGSVQQIYVSPLRPWEFIAGKMIAYMAIAGAELLLLLGFGYWWFGLPFRGSLTLLLAGALLYVLCTVSIGLLVSTLTRSQTVALLLAIIITVMPSFLFSGFLYPISSMPEMVQWYTRLFPVRYFMELSRGIFLKGTGLPELGAQLVLLALYTTTAFTAAVVRFQKRIA